MQEKGQALPLKHLARGRTNKEVGLARLSPYRNHRPTAAILSRCLERQAFSKQVFKDVHRHEDHAERQRTFIHIEISGMQEGDFASRLFGTEPHQRPGCFFKVPGKVFSPHADFVKVFDSIFRPQGRGYIRNHIYE